MGTSELTGELTGERAVLDELLHPVSSEEFFADYYERKPLLVQRNDPAYFAGLLTLDDIDAAITDLGLSPPQVRMVNADSEEPLEERAYRGPGGIVDPARVFQLFDEGATIILSQLHRRINKLQRFCLGLERVLSQPFQTNIYVTPAKAKGFKVHYDTHDVFVVQLAGTKAWNVYDVPVELPLRSQHFDSGVHEVGEPTMQFELKAGDMIYIPRGYVHDARSTDQLSAHITVGVLAKTWTDFLLEAVASACLTDPRFRASLPVGFAGEDLDRAAAGAQFAELWERLGASVDVDAVLDGFIDEFVGSRRVPLRGQFAEVLGAGAVGADDWLEARGDLIVRFGEADQGDTLTLRAAGVELALPVYAKEALTRALSGEPFQPRDLPGDVDEAGKVTLARRLIREGLIVHRAN